MYHKPADLAEPQNNCFKQAYQSTLFPCEPATMEPGYEIKPNNSPGVSVDKKENEEN